MVKQAKENHMSKTATRPTIYSALHAGPGSTIRRLDTETLKKIAANDSTNRMVLAARAELERRAR